ncbi:hypothetical protein K439DRAFT_855788 [Ramaria rubella]|nr:hypothetical protein K439DRAFT_855788 [Ramaria rubella]
MTTKKEINHAGSPRRATVTPGAHLPADVLRIIVELVLSSHVAPATVLCCVSKMVLEWTIIIVYRSPIISYERLDSFKTALRSQASCHNAIQKLYLDESERLTELDISCPRLKYLAIDIFNLSCHMTPHIDCPSLTHLAIRCEFPPNEHIVLTPLYQKVTHLFISGDSTGFFIEDLMSQHDSLEFLTSVTHLVLAIPPSPCAWSHVEPLDTRKEGRKINTLVIS